MKTIYLKVDGIHCISCEIKIKSALLKEKNIKDVKFLNNIVSIYYEDNINKEKIVDIINNLEYKTKVKYFNDNL